MADNSQPIPRSAGDPGKSLSANAVAGQAPAKADAAPKSGATETGTGLIAALNAQWGGIAKSKKLIPDVEDYMFVKGGTAGVRAQAISPQGDLIMDFNIIKENNQIHVLNAPSPGATASLAIAKYLIKNYID